MQRIEQDCVKTGIPLDTLMENAGKAVAGETRRILETIAQRCILCLIGPGNNGGDGLVAARYLHDWGATVSVYLCARKPAEDPKLALVKKHGIPIIEGAQDENFKRLDELLSSVNCIIDAIFGTGKVRPFGGVIQRVLERVAAARRKNKSLRIVAVDLPSGLNADSGEVDPACLYADDTVTLGFPKPGLFSFPGAARVGRLTVAAIGIPGHLADSVNREMITTEWARSVLPHRPLNANKGTFGKVLVAGGSINYTGAVYLACSGAMRVGAGLVTLATGASLLPILAAKLTEVTYLPLPETQPGIISPRAAGVLSEQFSRYNTLVLGCGLGQNPPAEELVRSVLFSDKLPPLVLDADGLNALAKIPKWWQKLAKDAILTPHPGEMARLLNVPVAEVQRDRLNTAGKFAGEWQKTVVLKGAYTVITAPDGRSRLCPMANPGLASAGTGDVLCGAIGGLVAQGLSLFDAAALGVYLHAAAGEMVKDRIGDTGMIAGDLLPMLPLAIKQLRHPAEVS